jgi:hypothetical protein
MRSIAMQHRDALCAENWLSRGISSAAGLEMSSPHLAAVATKRILTRSKDGLKHAKARGVHCGRPPALNDYGESARSVARLLGVSHVTVAKLRVA